jgi:ABC-2 type transport system permease protein
MNRPGTDVEDRAIPSSFIPPPSSLIASESQPVAADQGRIFRRLRTTLFRNGLRVALESGRARLFGTLATCVFVALFTFAVGLYLFDQLRQNNIPFKGAIVEALFDLLFFTLGSMLVFSSGIILFASLFTSAEARFLLCSSARADQIFSTKFQGAIAFSSWGFVVLGIPIFLAFGVVSGVPWHFYVLLPAFLLGYVLLPGSVSAALCLLLVRYMPRNRRQFFAIVGLIAAALILLWMYRVGVGLKKSLISSGRELDELINQFDLLRSGVTPSHWMTRGVMAAARDDLPGALVPLAQVWSNGLLLFVAATWIARRTYRTAYDRLAGSGRGKKVYRASRLDQIMGALVWYLDSRTRVLVVKDFRTFRRDPTQWALLLIFGLLMMLGASNFRQYYSADLAIMDKYALSLINLCGTSVLLCAGLSRFIFPLISLEGRKFWILGLTPVSRDQLLWGKFVFAATGSLMIAEGLILVSDLLIGLPAEGLFLHAVVAAVVAIGLSALNVGLGAYMPTFNETDPSKIVVGFGGTVNMVVGLGFLVAVIGMMAVPFHAAQLARGVMGTGRINPLVFAGMAPGLALGAAAVILPLRAGARSLRAIEF